jgi:diguanylate cyclase (GGDEF)-like protein/PAS domain S-box-containing protein
MSVVDVLRGEVARERVDGKTVIVGATAAELRDFFTVPVYGSISGSLAQALGAESVAQGRALAVTGRAVAALGVLAISLAYLFVRALRWTRLLALLAASLAAVEATALLAQRLWPIVPETGALDVAFCGFALLTLLREIDFRRILILIARNRASNTQTILDRVVEDNFAGVIVADEAGNIRAASRAAAAILDTKGELLGRTTASFLPPYLSDEMRSAIEAAHRGERPSAKRREYRYRRRDGRRALLEYVVTPSRLAGGLAHTGTELPDMFVATLTFVDATEEREAASRISYLARFDTLTGLPNRNQFIEALDVALRRGALCAVVCFDVDRFKYLNDTLGHDVGDLVLQAVAGRARRLMAPGDLVARFGADDFAIICAGGNVGTRARTLAEDLIAQVGEPYDLSGHRQAVALSFGLAVAEPEGADSLNLLQRADTALAIAKANGGNSLVSFDPGMAAGLRKRQNLETHLWEAFEREEFEVHYQPQVDLADERIVGFEALLRWRHPLLGYVPPTEFIPIAEATGLILKLGAWVLEEACMTAATWPHPIALAVNVSPVQLARGDLVRTVAKALARSGLPADRLGLEITESVLLQENCGVRTAIDELLGMGVRFALDDFGTGYSSLTYIHKFPIAKVKIDRSFVSEIVMSQEAAAIVRAVAALTRSLDIRLNAEGIEAREQLDLLRLLGCAEGQGYLFGKPGPKETASKLIMSRASLIRADRAAS